MVTRERRTFTVEEANRILPELRKVVSLIQNRMKWLAANKPRIPYLVEQLKIPDEAPVSPAYFGNLHQVRRALGALESMGCQLKDIDKGLVDFPSVLGGREVLLCWHLGEESVSHYHDLNKGYAGRRPLPGSAGSGGTEEDGGSSGESE